jgi:catechol 2,3-dioxygenase-like lactoylglutathione lyase family enzyme
MKIDRIHHVAYRCKDAKATVEFYTRMLNMDFVLAIAEDQVPSTHEPDPYMHVFLDAGAGNVLAFFELPTKPEMGRDPNTPKWVQHIAFKVKTARNSLNSRRIWKTTGSRFWASPTTPSFIRSISLTRMATGWNLPAPTLMRKRCWRGWMR